MSAPVWFDVSDRTQLTVLGRDRAKFIHNFCTNDIVKLQPGQGTEAFITSSQGKTIGHVLVACLPDRLILNTVADQGAFLTKHLDRYLITEDVTMRDTTSVVAQRLVAGEGVVDRLRTALGVGVPTGRLECSELPCFVQRVEMLGPESYLLAYSRDEAAAWDAKLTAAGFERGDDPTALRIAGGWPEFGVDFGEDNLPQEVGRDTQAISFKKGCYLGQETVARLDALGHVNRKLVRVRFAGPVGAEFVAEEKVIGKVTSAADGVAWTLLKAAFTRPGTALQSASGPAETI